MLQKIIYTAQSALSALPIFDLTSGQKISIVAIMCIMSTLATSIYLHRCKTHKAVKLHPIIEFFFELILWLNTGVKSFLWVVFHRYHHATSDTEDDPHGPNNPINLLGWKIRGPLATFLDYFLLYGKISNKKVNEKVNAMVSKERWITRNLFHPLSILGPVILLLSYSLLFGISGIWMFAIQFLYLPVVSGGAINGLGHSQKTLDEKTKDYSSNIGSVEKLPRVLYWIIAPPLSIATGGEWPHHVHHLHQNSAKIAEKKWEFDIGWIVIYLLWFFRLARDVYYVKDGKQRVSL